MASMIQRAASKVFGLPMPDDLSDLKFSMKLALDKARGASSGVPMTWGDYQTEFNNSLKGAKRWKTLDKMEADPHVKGALRTNTLPMITAEWEIQPATDDPRDVEIAEFCEANLLRTSGDTYGRDYWIDTPWKSQRLPEILSFLRDGFSIFQKSLRRVGSKVVYDRLQWIEPSTITRWQLGPNDALLAIERTYSRQTGKNFNIQSQFNVTTPASELKLYTWDMKGARYNGRSMIRSMYGPWFRKDFIQRISIIWAQKVGAPVPVGIYPKGWDADQVEAFDDFVKSTLGSAPAEAWGSFEMGPGDQKPSLTYVGAETGDIDRSTVLVDAENREISHAAGTKLGVMGETAGGNRALGDSVGLTDMMGVEAVAEVIAEQEAHGVGTMTGVIEELVDMNFAGVQKYPKLACPKVNPFERVEIIKSVILPAVAAGVIPNVPDLRRQIADVAGITLPDNAFEQKPEVPTLPGTEGQEGVGDSKPKAEEPKADKDPPDKDKKELALRARRTEEFRARIAHMLEPIQGGAPASGGGFRAPNRLETEFVMLAEINKTFTLGEDAALVVLRKARRKMIEELMGRLRAGKITPRSVSSQKNSNFRGEKKAIAELEATLTKTGRLGIDHVDAEMSRQRGF